MNKKRKEDEEKVMNQLKEQLVEQLFKANQPGQIPVVDPKKENSSKNESPSIPLLPILETKTRTTTTS